MTTVVNRRHTQAYDIYIGRPSEWGNPFKIGLGGDRAMVIASFRDWFYAPAQAAFRQRARSVLKGKVLGCWCPPLPCHGHVYAEYCDAETWNTCPDCGVKWEDFEPTIGLLHRTQLCGPCAAVVDY